jgi:hypothetical protein
LQPNFDHELRLLIIHGSDYSGDSESTFCEQTAGFLTLSEVILPGAGMM